MMLFSFGTASAMPTAEIVWLVSPPCMPAAPPPLPALQWRHCWRSGGPSATGTPLRQPTPLMDGTRPRRCAAGRALCASPPAPPPTNSTCAQGACKAGASSCLLQRCMHGPLTSSSLQQSWISKHCFTACRRRNLSCAPLGSLPCATRAQGTLAPELAGLG